MQVILVKWWSYLIKVITETRRAHYVIRYLRFINSTTLILICMPHALIQESGLFQKYNWKITNGKNIPLTHIYMTVHFRQCIMFYRNTYSWMLLHMPPETRSNLMWTFFNVNFAMQYLFDTCQSSCTKLMC